MRVLIEFFSESYKSFMYLFHLIKDNLKIKSTQISRAVLSFICCLDNFFDTLSISTSRLLNVVNSATTVKVVGEIQLATNLLQATSSLRHYCNFVLSRSIFHNSTTR